MESLNLIPPIPNKYKKPVKENMLTEEDYNILRKRVDNIEKTLDNINVMLNLQTIHKLRKKLNQIEGEINGSNSRSKINP